MPGQEGRKFACSATRKVGSAVVRNRHRRKLKEFYRLNKHLWPENTHFFALFRINVGDWGEMESKLTKLLQSIPHPPSLAP
ncbi:MAG: ribonuclease P protein component [Calditrichaeota bacterium]|nr:ribonuclease P protein component [Calditrichota bacterium]